MSVFQKADLNEAEEKVSNSGMLNIENLKCM